MVCFNVQLDHINLITKSSWIQITASCLSYALDLKSFKKVQKLQLMKKSIIKS